MKSEGTSKKKLKKTIKISTAVVLLSTAVLSVIYRLPLCFDSQNPAALAAAAFTLTNGEYKLESSKAEKPTESDQNPTESTDTQPVAVKNHKRDKSTYYDSYGNHDGENKYTVEERTIGDTGTQVDNCFVKNKTGLSLDFDGLLSAKLPFSIDKGINSPQVLIYHTHTSEAYLDEDVDFFYDRFYSRTNNNDFNVVAVGDALTEQLNKRGIKTIHDTTIHDESYNGSYDRSVDTVYKNLEKYPDIKVVIDLHRDAIGTDENKVKPVFTYNGKKGAQIMILAGCDTDGERGFDCWEENLNFALKIQDKAETLYPDMTRPLNFDYFAYNEYVCNGSLLIEVGTESNSIDEATYSGSLLGNAIADVLLGQ